ncbi:MAG: TIGR02281 family clan AA aspartic protease [Bauldia sp.]
MLRLLAIASVLVVIGVYTPRFAPGLVASFVEKAPEPALPAPIAVKESPAAVSLSPRKVALIADLRGHFSTTVTINGRQIDAMIDTGATMVALNEATAGKLGIRPPRGAYTEPVSTAGGIVKAAPVILSDVRLGGIRLTAVPAIVVPGDTLPVNLLGMSFLSRLSSFEVSRNRLVLVD